MVERLSKFRRLDCEREDKPKAELVAIELKKFIAKGHYAPGEKLPSERALAEALHVSRVSIRAAMQQLKTQGLVESKTSGGGTKVSFPMLEACSPLFELVTDCRQNLEDLFQINTQLDAWGVRRAAQLITDQQIGRLRGLVRDYQQDCGNSKSLAELDQQIHLEIAQVTESAVYINMVMLTRDVLTRVVDHFRVQIFGDLVHASQLGRKNWLLVEALAERNPEKAESIIRDRREYFSNAIAKIHDINLKKNTSSSPLDLTANR